MLVRYCYVLDFDLAFILDISNLDQITRPSIALLALKAEPCAIFLDFIAGFAPIHDLFVVLAVNQV